MLLPAVQMGKLLSQMFQCYVCPVIPVIYLEPTANFNFTYCSADWINHRDESLITISDSSDEDLPLLLEMPEKQQAEEDDDDDDIVILAEVIFHCCSCCAVFMACIAKSCANT